MPYKCIPGYRFTKWICNRLVGRNVFQNHFILHDHISDKMISNLGMFGLPMILWILSISQYNHAVTMKSHELKRVLTTSKSCKNLFNQTASCITEEQVIYSTSIIDKAI